jgi:hypothetical protein
VFPVKYQLNFYILFGKSPIFKGLNEFLKLEILGSNDNINITVFWDED